VGGPKKGGKKKGGVKERGRVDLDICREEKEEVGTLEYTLEGGEN